MNNNELLTSISELLDQKLDEKLDKKFDEKLQPVIRKINDVDKRLSAQINDVDKRLSRQIKENNDKIDSVNIQLSHRIDKLNTRLSSETKHLGFAIHKTNILIENELVPLLNEIRSCHLDTYKRYIETTDCVEKLCADMEVVKSVLRNHLNVNIA